MLFFGLTSMRNPGRAVCLVAFSPVRQPNLVRSNRERRVPGLQTQVGKEVGAGS